MITIQCFSVFPISLDSSSSSQIKPYVCPIFGSNIPSLSKLLYKSRNRTVSRSKDFIDAVDPAKESAYLDENGVVEDMDGYLNYLSLEYDSVWDTKPAWCQPWTITLTGVGVVTSSWLILKSILVTSLASTLICAWWYIFLYSYPKMYTDMIEERRNKVRSGSEDIYGIKTEE